MIIKSLKGDGIEHLACQFHIDAVGGWEWLSQPLVPTGIDPDTGEETYSAAAREVIGERIEIELENNTNDPITVAFQVWFQKKDYSTATAACSPIEIKTGETKAIELVLDEKRICIWCLIKL